MEGGGIFGGAEFSNFANSIKTGGIDVLTNYVGSSISKRKQELIIKIAKALSKQLNIKQLDPSNKTLDQIIKTMKDVLPNPAPNGNGLTWKDDSKSQKKACEVIANLMKEDGLNVSSDPNTMCDEVIEYVYSLFTSMNGELLATKMDIEKNLKNIKVLQRFIESNYNVILNKISQDKESSIAQETAIFRQNHKDIVDELNRQMTILQNLLDTTISPMEKDMAELLKESGDFKGLVKKIKSYPGTDKFAEKISYLLGGIRTAAAAAKLVDKALSDVGMSRKEFAKLTPKDLKVELSKKIQNSLNLTDEDLKKLTKAVETLVNYGYMRDEIVKEFDEEKTGKGEGGEEKTGGLKLDKRVKRKELLKIALLRSFNERLSDIFSRLLKEADQISKNISGDLINTDSMNDFVRALEELPDIQKKSVYFALSGFNGNIQSKQEREQFISHAKHVVATLETLLKNKDYAKIELLKDFKENFQELIKLINDYSNRFEQEIGISGANELDDNIKQGTEMVNQIAKASEEISDNVTKVVNNLGKVANSVVSNFNNIKKSIKGEGEEIEGGDDDKKVLPEITRLGYTFNKAIDLIRYSVRTTKIRNSLKNFSKENKSYGENYRKILGDAIANSIDNFMKEKSKYMATDYETNVSHPLHILYKALIYSPDAAGLIDRVANPQLDATRILINNARGSLLKTGQELEDAKTKFAYTQQLAAKMIDCKIDLYKVAESADWYMKAFADGIASNPDDIKDIVSILQNTELISSWFTNKSGDYLCQFFETFPGGFKSTNPVYSNLDNNDMPENHYYVRVAVYTKLGDSVKVKNNFNLANTYINITNPNQTYAQNIANIVFPGSEKFNAPGGGLEIGLPGNPFLGLPVYAQNNQNSIIKSVKYLSKALSIGVLKNIMSMFINIGRKFGNKNLEKESPMSPIQMYKSLMSYIMYSSFTYGFNNLAHMGDIVESKPIELINQTLGAANDVIDRNGQINAADQGRPISNNEIAVGVTTLSDIGGAAPANAAAYQYSSNLQAEFEYSYCLLRTYSNFAHTRTKSFFDDESDVIFTMIVKSMVTKILTVMGTYNMLHRPISKNALGYPTSLRMILGGSDNEPKVIPEAMELYIRLPLLAEFYREIFNFDEVEANSFSSINLVPEFDGIFAGIINIVFDKAKSIKQGEYTGSDIRSLIEEINKLYTKYANKPNPTEACVEDFVNEVNRRYGVIKLEERKSYIEKRNKRFESKYEQQDEITDFELEGLDEDEPNRPGPSASFLTEGLSSIDIKNHKNKININGAGSDLYYINKFREAIDEVFKAAKPLMEDNSARSSMHKTENISFSKMIRSRKEELKNAKTDKEKFDIVSSSMNALGNFAITHLEKALLLFNEIVVYPINLLSSNYKILKAFEDKISSMYNCLKALGIDEITEDKNRSFINILNDNVKRISLSNIDPAGGAGAFNVPNNIINFSICNVNNFAGLQANQYWNDNIKPYMNYIDYNHDPDDNRINLIQANPLMNGIAVEMGRQGATNHIVYGMIQGMIEYYYNLVGNNPEKDLIKQFLQRFLIHQGKMFIHLFETLFAHQASFSEANVRLNVQKKYGQNNGTTCLIECYVDNSKLFEDILETFNQVKNNIDKFRGIVPKDIITKYENSNSTETLYWLEQKLVFELIHGKRENNSGNYYSMDQMNSKIKTILNYFTKEWTVNANVTDQAGGQRAAAVGGNTYTALFGSIKPRNQIFELNNYIGWADQLNSYNNQLPSNISIHEFDREIKFILSINTHLKYTHILLDNRLGGNFNILQTPVVNRGVNSLLFNNTTKVKNGAAVGARYNTHNHNSLYNFMYSDNGEYNIDNYRSIWVNFNRLVQNYISQIFDSNTKKTYITTLKNIVSGVMNQQIMGIKYSNEIIYDQNGAIVANQFAAANAQNTTRDLIYNATEFRLIKRLSLIIQHLYTDMSGTNLEFIESDINNIAQYVKDKMKCNLPIIKTMSEILIKKTQMLKYFVEGLNVAQVEIGISPNPVPGGGAPVLCQPTRSRVENEKNMLADCDYFIQALGSINQAIKDTLNEIPDTPRFMETYNNFIQIYENENKTNPYMPLSSLGYYTRDLNSLNYEVVSDTTQIKPAFPEYTIGDPKFKMLYGSRKILYSDFKLDDLYGFKQILKDHNISTETRHTFDEKQIEPFAKKLVGLNNHTIKWNNYVKYFTVRLCSYKDVLTANNINLCMTIPLVKVKPKKKMSIYQIRNNNKLTDIISLTEGKSTDGKLKIVDTLQVIEGCPNRNNRKTMMAYNIIDLNIMPIRISALMREIPLINLINYSYTFDCMVHKSLEYKKDKPFIEKAKDKTQIINLNDIIRDKSPAKRLLTAMMVNPYTNIDWKVYYYYFAAIVRGSMGIEGFGRPKYLGDEIYNKALFGELYPGGVYREEMGPPGGMAHLRGKEEVIKDTEQDLTKLKVIDKTETLRKLIYIAINYFRRTRLNNGAVPGNPPTEVNFAEISDQMIRDAIEVCLNGHNKATAVANNLHTIGIWDSATKSRYPDANYTAAQGFRNNIFLQHISLRLDPNILTNLNTAKAALIASTNNLSAPQIQIMNDAINYKQHKNDINTAIAIYTNAILAVYTDTTQNPPVTITNALGAIVNNGSNLNIALAQLNRLVTLFGNLGIIFTHGITNAAFSLVYPQARLPNTLQTEGIYRIVDSVDATHGFYLLVDNVGSGHVFPMLNILPIDLMIPDNLNNLINQGNNIQPFQYYNGAANVRYNFNIAQIIPNPNPMPTAADIANFNPIIVQIEDAASVIQFPTSFNIDNAIASLYNTLYQNRMAIQNSAVLNVYQDNYKTTKDLENKYVRITYISYILELLTIIFSYDEAINYILTNISNNMNNIITELINVFSIIDTNNHNGALRNVVVNGRNVNLPNSLNVNANIFGIDQVSIINLLTAIFANQALRTDRIQYSSGGANYDVPMNINYILPVSSVQESQNYLTAKLKYAFMVVNDKLFEEYAQNIINELEKKYPDYFPSALHYLDQDSDMEAIIKRVDLFNEGSKRYLQIIGKMRFDTTLVRNLFWLSNIQRILIMKLSKDVKAYDPTDKIISNLAITNSDTTEYFGNRVPNRK